MASSTVPSAPPQSPSGVANSPNQVTLTWSPPPRIDVNGDLQYYALQVTEVETGRRWTFYTVDTFITIGGLHPHFNYRCQVAAHTVLGSGPFTNPFYVQTRESGMFTTMLHTCLYDYRHLVMVTVFFSSLFSAPTATPSVPQLTTLTSRSFSLMWQPPPFEQINGDIRRYTLLIVESETGRQFEVTTNDTQIIISSLHPYYNYMCRVRAETTQPGPYSVAISVHLLEEGTYTNIVNIS